MKKNDTLQPAEAFTRLVCLVPTRGKAFMLQRKETRDRKNKNMDMGILNVNKRGLLSYYLKRNEHRYVILIIGFGSRINGNTDTIFTCTSD
jgi:hypothetical protein